MKDRLATFQELMQLQMDPLETVEGVDSQVPSFDTSTENFLEKVDLIQEKIRHIQDLVEELKRSQEMVLTDAFYNQALENALEELLKEIQEVSGSVHQEIKALQKEIVIEAMDELDTTDRMKQSQASALLCTFKDVMYDYYDAQTRHSEDCKARIKRQLNIIGKDKTESEIEEMLQKGTLQLDLQIETEEAAVMVQKVESRHHEIQEIEKGINVLNTMFKEMYYLVISQGDMIDNIERNVQASADVVSRAVPKLHMAHKYRRKRMMFCCPCLAYCSIL